MISCKELLKTLSIEVYTKSIRNLAEKEERAKQNTEHMLSIKAKSAEGSVGLHEDCTNSKRNKRSYNGNDEPEGQVS